MILYDYYRSSACFRVRIALYLKQIHFDIKSIHLLSSGGEHLTSEYEKINPQQLVPALIDNGKTITQSLAIIDYLENKYPSPSLIPTHAYDKAYVKSLALMIACDIHPLNNLRVLNYLKKELECKEDKKQQWYQHWVEEGLNAIEKKLRTSSFANLCCYGDEPTLADICLIPQVYNALRFNINIDKYPIINNIFNYCQLLPSFKLAWPKEEKVTTL